MRYLTWAGLGLLFVANLAIGGAVPPPPCSPLYAENGDAGNRFANNPQDVSGGSFCGFSGTIGTDEIVVAGFETAAIDTEDAFRFFFSGGDFRISVVFPAPGGGQEGDLLRALYTDTNRVTPIAPGSTDTWLGLDAGIYVFELTTIGFDPPFTIGLIGPAGDPITFTPISAPIPQQEAPEPGALALMLAGLAGLGALRRRAKAA